MKWPTKKTLVLLATLLVVGVGGWYVWSRNSRPTVPTAPTAPSNIKLAPATQEEKNQADQNKDQIVQDQNSTPSPTPSGKKTVSVVITTASTSTVKAYATGIIEDGGTCTATFTQGTTTVTRTSSGFSNVSYTQCAPISPNLPSSGSWSVSVSYSSAAAEGQSSALTFQ